MFVRRHIRSWRQPHANYWPNSEVQFWPPGRFQLRQADRPKPTGPSMIEFGKELNHIQRLPLLLAAALTYAQWANQI